VVDELVPRNVAALVGPITPDRPKRGTLTLDQSRQLLAAADAAGEGALVAVMLGLGLRRGEALGLRWSDVDLEAGRLTVAGAWAVGDGTAYWEAAKADSERTVHLPDAITRRLRTQRANQKLQRVCAGPRWHAGDWVFTGPSGQPRNPGGVTEKVKAIAAEAGLGHWTPHGLRHSAASILLAMKVPLKVVSELLGHSSIRVTGDIYSHVMEPARAEAADAMQAAIFS
jgi:integrase